MLSTGALWNLMWNKEAFVYGIMGDWNRTWFVPEEDRCVWISLLLSRTDSEYYWLVYRKRKEEIKRIEKN